MLGYRRYYSRYHPAHPDQGIARTKTWLAINTKTMHAVISGPEANLRALLPALQRGRSKPQITLETRPHGRRARIHIRGLPAGIDFHRRYLDATWPLPYRTYKHK